MANNNTVIVHKSSLSYKELPGVDPGRAVYVDLFGDDSTAKLRSSFVEMEEVVIPRQARVEELLFIISGSIRIEEDGSSRIVQAGDTIHLSAESAPTYHVGEKTLIFASYL